MNAIVEIINGTGRAFVGFAVPMLLQSGLLILILLAVDAVLRRRVRAVFRYWVWMLVLVKLVLPPSLGSPVSVGTWLGSRLEVSVERLLESQEPPVEPVGAEPSSVAARVVSQPDPALTEMSPPQPTAASPLPPSVDVPPESVVTDESAPFDLPPPISLSWQGLALLGWLAVAAALLLLLVQRAFFVRGLVAQADEANEAMRRALELCRQRLGLRRAVALRLSPHATSPAVCGLRRPVVLVPQNLAPRLRASDLQAVLLHELAHIKRGDLWVNLVQTLLQIVYFYNPLLWLANAAIRRVREQAVDEAVLVAMGETASQYPQTLVNVAKLAFHRRPALSLRLIGVVESKSALTARIRHILSRPLPTTARLGVIGLLAVLILAAVLLPMAKGSAFGRWFNRDRLMLFEMDDNLTGIHQLQGNVEVFSREYRVKFREGEQLLVLAELYQTGRLMQTLGYKVFPGTTRPETLAVSLRKRYVNAEKTSIQHDVSVTLGGEAFRVEALVETPSVYPNSTWGFFTDSEIRSSGDQPYVEMENLLLFKSDSGKPRDLQGVPRIWIPGYNHVTWTSSDVYFVIVKMLALSQLDRLEVEPPFMAYPEQLPDGTYLPADASKEQRQAVAQEYVLDLKRLLMRDHMPLPELVAHRYYKADEPIHIRMSGKAPKKWKSREEEINHSPFFMLIDGREYESTVGTPPFSGVGLTLEVPDHLGIARRGWNLAPGRHTVAYGWKDVDVVDPSDPDHPVHFDRLVTDPVEFEVVEQLPPGYYGQVYEEGWEDILRRSIETPFTDDMRQYGVFGPLLAVRVGSLPFDTAFAVYVQAEGSDEQHPVGELARPAESLPHIMGCDRNVKELNWDTVGDKRWRIVLKPSVEVAKKHPPIRAFYGREFTTDWLSFERSPRFEENRRRAERHANENWSPTPASAFSRTLPNGVAVELLGVCEYPSEGRQWWRPDGETLSEAPCTRHKGDRMFPGSDERAYEFCVRLRRLPDGGQTTIKVLSSHSLMGGSSPALKDGRYRDDLRWLAAILSENQKSCTVRCGVAAGAWQTAAQTRGEAFSGTGTAGGGITFSPASDDPEAGAMITTSDDILDRPCRVVAVTTDGRIVIPSRTSSGTAGRVRQTTSYFKGLTPAQIAEFQFQTRPWVWVEFKNVSLRPGRRTDVQIPMGSEDTDRGAGGGAPAGETTNESPDESEKTPFSVYGRATDQSGQPMPGVEVTAHCGFATLMPTGRTLTDETGRYTLHFGPGLGFHPDTMPVQAATIHAAKSGFYEVNLCRQGGLAMARKAPGEEDKQRVSYYLGVVLPNKPYELNFVMRPAARIEGRLVDANGKPLPGRTLHLTGDELYPSTSVLASVETDRDRAFVVERIPLESYWFEYGDRPRARTRSIDFTTPGTWRIHLMLDESQGTPRLTIADIQSPTSPITDVAQSTTSVIGDPAHAVPPPDDPPIPPDANDAGTLAPKRAFDATAAAHEVSGRVLDPDGKPVVGAQVALTAQCRQVMLRNGVLEEGDIENDQERQLVETDGEGWFRFKGRWSHPFYLLAAHAAGFAAINGKDFQNDREIRLERWGRIEGQLAKGRGGTDSRVWMMGLPRPIWTGRQCDFRYDSPCGADGRFVFERVPAGWFHVGYLIAMTDDFEGFTARTAVVVKPGETATVKVGGEGRPIIGRFVPPPSYGRSVYFGAGPRALRCSEGIDRHNEKMHQVLMHLSEADLYVADAYPLDPRTEDFIIESQGNQKQWWYQPWCYVEEDACLADDAIWNDVAWRGYAFRISPDGSFRIEDVVPGRYELSVDLEERDARDDLRGPFALYRGTIEVPSETYTDQPLDLGTLTLNVFGVGDPAPLFETETFEGHTVRLVKFRGKFVLLVFSMPEGPRELDRLKELHRTYSAGDDLQIIELIHQPSTRQVEQYTAQHGIEWALIRLEDNFGEGIMGEYGLHWLPYILLVDPEGRIVAADLRGERLTNTVRDALGSVPAKAVATSPAALQTQGTSAPPRVGPRASEQVQGVVVDPDGKPLAGAQVALITDKIGVVVRDGKLEQPQTSGTGKGQIVETDAQGRFRFEGEPNDGFSLVAAHEAGFATVGSDEFATSREIRLEPWGRVEGQVAEGRWARENQIWMSGLPNVTWLRHRRDYRYETYCDSEGRFVFKRVPAGRFEVGYLTRMGDATSSLTSRTPVVVKPGETTAVKLGGEGRPVIGRFVPPAGHSGTVHFGWGLRSLQTRRPDPPRPPDYDQMTRRQQQEWTSRWWRSAEAKAYSDAIWQNPDWRAYVFSINPDGSFRIEDVIPGEYDLTVWLEERPSGQGRPEEIGSYNGVVKVPPMAETYTDEPLDLGELTLSMRNPVHVGDTAPLFEARTLDGKDIRLADYRGRFVLLSFWQPTSHMELSRLTELHETYAGSGKLQIIGLGGGDTLEEVKKYVAEHKIEWPQVYWGEKWNEGIAAQYGLGGSPYILLVDPEGKVVATWLRGEKLTETVKNAIPQAAEPSTPEAPSGVSGRVVDPNGNPVAGGSTDRAWQRTDRYVPPDPNGFFPDDPAGGQRLDALFRAVDKDRRPDEEILSTVRQGFRRTAEHRTLILRWIGNRYIWGKDPQHPQAIEIMYHAVPLERHYAVYFGLSVMSNKTPNVLRTLADICMQGEDVGRITWGVGPQRDELLACITPFLQDNDPGKRRMADLLVKHFKGELDFEQWQREKRQEQAKAQLGGRLPQLRQALLTGDSGARYQVFTTLMRAGGPALDDSFLPALAAAAADPSPKVRNEVARVVGGHWIWFAQEQDANAIALALTLASDTDREVRYNAVYYGLSTVRDKSEAVVRRLVEMALANHEINLYGRIVWGLKGSGGEAPESFRKTLMVYLDRAKADLHCAASVYQLHRDVLGTEPPAEWGLVRVRDRYPDDLFTVPFSARESWQPADANALWNEFSQALPKGVTAERLPNGYSYRTDICHAKVRGREQAEAVRKIIENHPRLRVGEIETLTVPMQLFLEERYGQARPQAQGASLRSPDEARTSPQSPPGPIQQKINAAAPGTTIRLEPGIYRERLRIDKPLVLEGAGWDKTTVVMESRLPESRQQAANPLDHSVLAVVGARGVTVRGIKFTSPGRRIGNQSLPMAIVTLSRCDARLLDCAVVGGAGDGTHIIDQSAVVLQRCLVAAVWGTGVRVGSGKDVSEARIEDSDIRNCHYAGIRIARNSKAAIERCRVSGAAWHGIRYDDAAPLISANLIFGNARSGIYASGQTVATVKGNLFYANEMGGMSGWFQNGDLIESNTFANNKGPGLAIVGASKPTVRRNIFYANLWGVDFADIRDDSPFAKSAGGAILENNVFWANQHEVQRTKDTGVTQALALDEKTGVAIDPRFTAPEARDFSLKPDSPAHQKGIGAAGLISFESPWPLQPEELAIIPQGDTRDSEQWRDPPLP